GRAGPEDAALSVDLLPGDAVVVGHAALRGDAQLLPDVAARAVREELATAEAPGQLDDDVDVPTCLAGRVGRPVDLDHPPFEVRGRPLILAPDRAGQHDVGQFRRLGHEEV